MLSSLQPCLSYGLNTISETHVTIPLATIPKTMDDSVSATGKPF